MEESSSSPPINVPVDGTRTNRTETVILINGVARQASIAAARAAAQVNDGAHSAGDSTRRNGVDGSAETSNAQSTIANSENPNVREMFVIRHHQIPSQLVQNHLETFHLPLHNSGSTHATGSQQQGIQRSAVRRNSQQPRRVQVRIGPGQRISLHDVSGSDGNAVDGNETLGGNPRNIYSRTTEVADSNVNDSAENVGATSSSFSTPARHAIRQQQRPLRFRQPRQVFRPRLFHQLHPASDFFPNGRDPSAPFMQQSISQDLRLSVPVADLVPFVLPDSQQSTNDEKIMEKSRDTTIKIQTTSTIENQTVHSELSNNDSTCASQEANHLLDRPLQNWSVHNVESSFGISPNNVVLDTVESNVTDHDVRHSLREDSTVMDRSSQSLGNTNESACDEIERLDQSAATEDHQEILAILEDDNVLESVSNENSAFTDARTRTFGALVASSTAQGSITTSDDFPPSMKMSTEAIDVAESENEATAFENNGDMQENQSCSLLLPCSILDLDQFKCSICFELMKEPVGCGKCAGRFCRVCLETALKVKNGDSSESHVDNEGVSNTIQKCPTCRVEFDQNQIQIDEVLQQKLLNLCETIGPVGCRFCGCYESIPSLLEVSCHESVCQHVRVACRFAPYGCNWKGPRLDLVEHELVECTLARLPDFLEQYRSFKQKTQQDVQALQHRIVNLTTVIDAQQHQLHRISMQSNSNAQQLVADQSFSTKDVWNLFHFAEYIVSAVVTTPRLLQEHTQQAAVNLIRQQLNNRNANNRTAQSKWYPFYVTENGRAFVSNVLCMLPTSLVLIKMLLDNYAYTKKVIFGIFAAKQDINVNYFNGDVLQFQQAFLDKHVSMFVLLLVKKSVVTIIVAFLGALMLYCMNVLDAESSAQWTAYDIHHVPALFKVLYRRVNLLSSRFIVSNRIAVSSEYVIQWRFILHTVSVCMVLLYYFVMYYFGNGIQSILIWCWSVLATIILPTALTSISMLATNEIRYNGSAKTNEVCRMVIHSRSIGRNMIPVLFGLKFGIVASFFGLEKSIDSILSIMLLQSIFSDLKLGDKPGFLKSLRDIIAFGDLPLLSKKPIHTESEASTVNAAPAASLAIMSNIIAFYFVPKSAYIFAHIVSDGDAVSSNFEPNSCHAIAMALLLNVYMESLLMWSARLGLRIHVVACTKKNTINNDLFSCATGPGLALFGIWLCSLVLLCVT